MPLYPTYRLRLLNDVSHAVETQSCGARVIQPNVSSQSCDDLWTDTAALLIPSSGRSDTRAARIKRTSRSCRTVVATSRHPWTPCCWYSQVLSCSCRLLKLLTSIWKWKLVMSCHLYWLLSAYATVSIQRRVLAWYAGYSLLCMYVSCASVCRYCTPGLV